MSAACLFVIDRGGLLRSATAAAAAIPSTAEADSIPAATSLQDDCLAALARFRAAAYRLVLLTDPAADPGPALSAFIDTLTASQGVPFAERRRCSHPAADGCDCALPGIGLVADCIADPSLDRSRSLLVGAGEHIAPLARAMGIQGFDLAGGSNWTAIAHEVLDRPRRARIRRKTRETDIEVAVDLDASAEPGIRTGIGFFDHMLEQLAKHGGFALQLDCRGDLQVDEHHTVEDCALALGQALREALADKRGIARFGFVLPMDEAEARASLDLSGRPHLDFNAAFDRERVGGLATELVGHFFQSLVNAMAATLHLAVCGDNDHHRVEALFKVTGRVLRQAFAREGDVLPSTKGVL